MLEVALGVRCNDQLLLDRPQTFAQGRFLAGRDGFKTLGGLLARGEEADKRGASAHGQGCNQGDEREAEHELCPDASPNAGGT